MQAKRVTVTALVLGCAAVCLPLPVAAGKLATSGTPDDLITLRLPQQLKAKRTDAIELDSSSKLRVRQLIDRDF